MGETACGAGGVARRDVLRRDPADVREGWELGGLVYQSLGTVSFSHPEEAADFPVPPGYARLVAVSSRYGLTVLADHAVWRRPHREARGGVRVPQGEAPRRADRAGRETSRLHVPLRGASHVSFSPDERTLAAVAGCAVHLFQTWDLDELAVQGVRRRGVGARRRRSARRCSATTTKRVRDLQWLAEFTGGASYLALVATEQDTEGERAKLVVGSAMTLDQTAPVAIAEGVRAFAVARGPDATTTTSSSRRNRPRRTPPPARTPEACRGVGRRSAAARWSRGSPTRGTARR